MKHEIILVPAGGKAPVFWPWAVSVALAAFAVGLFWWAGHRPDATAVFGAPTPGMQGALQSVGDIQAESVPGNLIGRPVTIERAYVAQVIGDFTFLVNPSADAPIDRAVLVVLLGEMTDRQAEELVEVRPGDTVAIDGMMRDIRTGAPESDPLLTADERRQILAHDLYVSARRVRVIAGPTPAAH